MIYSAEDKWNNDAPYMEHRSHKYYMKVGEGSSARYFYSPAEYMAYRLGLTKGHASGGDRQMAELRTKQANEIRRREAPTKVDRQMAKEERANTQQTKRRLATEQGSRQRAARRETFKEAARSQETYGQRQKMAYERRQTQQKMQEAAASRKAKQEKRDAAVRKKSGRNNIIERSVDLGNGKKVVTGGFGTYDIKRAAKKVGYKAKNAYSKAKKAATSSTAKKYKKKAKKTAQSAYKKGSSFVKKLLNR